MDGLIPRKIDNGPDADAFGKHGDDGPDVDAIEARYGSMIKRQTAETFDVATIERITGLKVKRGKA
ncbi:hypothetical protein [Methanofollis ethanolicus]|uniref:hypothetical protein n=1 Tax=Methanofollis ethanolicus TaxID=488124 RepID=UPI001F41C587|nr:hypothetical protein [Methanofollis ethanolicus]